MCRPRPLLADVGAASAAASAVVVVTNPLEVVKTRLQLLGEGERVSVRPGPLATLLSIWRKEGLRGVQSGLSAGIAYQIIMNGT